MNYKIKLIVLVLVLNSCAQIVTPDGGDKDTKPPELIKSIPQSGSLNIFPKKITLYFNEFIELKNKNDISISPSVNFIPKLSFSKNKVEIYLKPDSLIKNITYTINFGKSLVDINESNCLENFFYCFSTGSVLDTAQLFGQSLKIRENKGAQNAKVKLQSLQTKVTYKTKTDNNGKWNIYNLPQSDYQLTIHQDINSNDKIDHNEFYYFDSSIQLNNSELEKNSKLISYTYWDTSQKLKVKKATIIDNYQVGIVFNKPIKNINRINYSIGDNTNKKDNPLKSTNQLDSFILLHPFDATDTLKFSIQTDTIQKFQIRQLKNRKADSIQLQAKHSKYSDNDELIIVSNVPINRVNSEKIKVNNESNFKIITTNPYELQFSSPVKDNKTIVFLDGAITDINGRTNKKDTISITKAEENELGNLEFIIKDSTKTYEGPVIIKIYDSNRSYSIKSSLNKINKLNGLFPSTYSLEVYYDANSNEVWDEGNYLINVKPEEIMQLKDMFTIKPNWDAARVEIYME